MEADIQMHVFILLTLPVSAKRLGVCVWTKLPGVYMPSGSAYFGQSLIQL